MTDRLRRICDEIRELEPDEQAHVLSLLGDLGAMPEPDVERAWLLEARRRARLLADEAQELASSEAPVASRQQVNDFLKRRNASR